MSRHPGASMHWVLGKNSQPELVSGGVGCLLASCSLELPFPRGRPSVVVCGLADDVLEPLAATDTRFRNEVKAETLRFGRDLLDHRVVPRQPERCGTDLSRKEGNRLSYTEGWPGRWQQRVVIGSCGISRGSG